MNSSFKIVLPAGAAISVSAVEHELILQDGEYACKSTVFVGGTGMVLNLKTAIKVEPTDGGGTTVVKVESSSSYKPMPMPLPKLEAQEDVTAESNEMGGAAYYKVKLD